MCIRDRAYTKHFSSTEASVSPNSFNSVTRRCARSNWQEVVGTVELV